jgi:hypothetical protein
MVQLSATRCSYIAILWASLVSFAAITLCVASELVFIVVSVYFVMTQSGNFWIYRRILIKLLHTAMQTPASALSRKEPRNTNTFCFGTG